MSKILLITLSIIGVLFVGGFAWAKHNGYCSGGDFAGMVAKRVSKKLDLNEQQDARLRQFADSLRELRTDWTEDRTQMRSELDDLLAAPSLDRDRVMQLLDERHRAVAERKGAIVDAFADFSDSLQPEQRTRLAELIATRMEHRWAH